MRLDWPTVMFDDFLHYLVSGIGLNTLLNCSILPNEAAKITRK